MHASTRTLTMALVGFGFTTAAFAEGRLELVRNRFNQVQTAYAETKQYLETGNTDAAKPAAATLLDILSNACPYVQDIKERVDGIPTLQSSWKDVSYWCLELTLRANQLKDIIGRGDSRGPLSKVEEGFVKLGDSLKAAQDKFMEFGKNWQTVCETCK